MPERGAQRRTNGIGLQVGQTVTICKLNSAGAEVFAYPGVVAQVWATGARLDAEWTLPTATLDYTTFEPGEIIVVGSESTDDTLCYMLDDTVRYVNKAGRQINEHQIKPGTRIHVYYDGTGEPSVVNRVVVDQVKHKTRKLKTARS